VTSWEPEFATWTTHALDEAQSPAAREPVMGWLTYLHTDTLPEPLPCGSTATPFANGILIQAAPTFPEVNEQTILRLRRHLQQHAALRPIP